jgi:3-hydroxyacyl-CoA dehydrogenase
MASEPPVAAPIRRAAVIGAGTMGAAIAAHLTNAGIPTLLLDIPEADPKKDRNAVAKAGLERARQARPPAFMDAAAAGSLLTLGNTEDDLPRLAEADWVIEAIIEQPAAKQNLWQEVERLAGPGTIFSSNSSGIPMHVQSEGRSESFRRRFLGVHFYNPPRYLYLLELIPTADTSPEVLETIRVFGDRVLGKGIVFANDVPGFIGNRIGIYSLLHTVRVMEEMDLDPALADALTGPILGRPKSATLRTADTVGIDVLGLISADLLRATDDNFRLPAIMERLLERRWLGEKTGGGFYQRRKSPGGASAILTLNPHSMEYEEKDLASLPAEVAASAKLRGAAERTRALLESGSAAGEFTRRTLYEMMRFAAEKYGVVANTHYDIDRALKWGFGWELGPFELFDALGAEFVLAGFQAQGFEVPRIFAEHARTGEAFYSPASPGPGHEGLILLKDLNRQGPKVVRAAENASLIDLDDGVLLLEFHNKANSLGADAFRLVATAIELVPGAYEGLVIGNQGRWFSAGADLGALLRDAETGHGAGVTAMIENFQRMTTSLRAAPFPVVAAPFQMTLGGGCEMMLYSDAVQADAELATGLVELKVGLMPSAGGTTEMLARALARLPAGADEFEAVAGVFALITEGRVSASALEARRLGFLRETDGITMNRRRLLGDAKEKVLALAAAGYQAPAPRELRVLGAEGYERLLALAQARRDRGEWSDYDVHLAGELARILTGGGEKSVAGVVPEQRLLDLERAVFVGLCAEPKTHERIRHMLASGKPLRN